MMRVRWIAVLVTLGLAQDSLAQDTPALKLRSEQTQRVRALARSVQTQATLLQARLDERQRELAELYDHYELDECRAQEVQAEIVDLQRAMLANHHRMQVELRAIVDQERFTILRQRLRYLVAPTDPAAPKQEPSPEPRQPADNERKHE